MERVPLNAFQRDILLVPFPFSDLSGQKVRPVVVISNDTFNTSSDDVLVCAITTTIKKQKYSILIDQTNIEEGNLHHSCCIKAESIVKISKKHIIKKIGKIDQNLFADVKRKIQDLL